MPSQLLAATPWDLMQALGPAAGAVMLHSGSNADQVGALTFVAAHPWREIVVRGARAELWQDARLIASREGQVAEAIEQWLADVGVTLHGEAQPLPWVAGYLGYEVGLQVGVGHKVQPRPPAEPKAAAGLPDAWLGIFTSMCQWEGHGAASGTVMSLAHQPLAPAWAHALTLAARGDAHAPRVTTAAGPLQARDGDERYLAALRRVLAYITAGDVYQVNLARQLRAAWPSGDALTLYRALSAVAPAPFGGVLQLAEGSIITNSPELFLRKQPGDARLETRPIKGTRRRAGDADHADDAALAAELLASEKDGAEHDMIVDLERNDLGRICDTGTVEVTRHGYALTLPHLIHRVSQVQGRVRPDVGLAALLAATFPGGSITGAPKLRAMQIIAELEPFARGPYCGAIGYLRRGELALSVAIRTAVLAQGEVTVTVGGGIVADSQPAAELEETTTKALGFAAALRALTR